MFWFLFFSDNKKHVHDFYQTMKDAHFPRAKEFFVFVVCSDFETLLQTYDIDAVVSPGNSLGFMDGGIDEVYKSVFPYIENMVKQKIKQVGLQTAAGRDYLPMGKGFCVDVNHKLCRTLIFTPTMFLPQDISETRNVEEAMKAVLHETKTLRKREGKDHILVAIPLLGTGFGKMSGKQSAEQTIQAFHKFHDSFLLTKALC